MSSISHLTWWKMIHPKQNGAESYLFFAILHRDSTFPGIRRGVTLKVAAGWAAATVSLLWTRFGHAWGPLQHLALTIASGASPSLHIHSSRPHSAGSIILFLSSVFICQPSSLFRPMWAIRTSVPCNLLPSNEWPPKRCSEKMSNLTFWLSAISKWQSGAVRGRGAVVGLRSKNDPKNAALLWRKMFNLSNDLPCSIVPFENHETAISLDNVSLKALVKRTTRH